MGVMKGLGIPTHLIEAMKRQGVELPEGANVISVTIDVGYDGGEGVIEYEKGGVHYTARTAPAPPFSMTDRFGPYRSREAADLPEPDPDNFWSHAEP